MAIEEVPAEAVQSAWAAFAELVRDPFGQALAWVGDHWPAVTVGLGAALATYLALRFAVGLMRRAVKRLAREQDYSAGDILRRLVQATSPLSILLFSLIVGVNLATGNARVEEITGTALALIAIFQLALYLRALLLAMVHRQASRAAAEGSALKSGMNILVWFVNTAVICIALLLMLDNFGIDVTALVAGLGVGGIAIGLAAQGIFKDLFSALSILFDKPFEKGDFVIVGAILGTIEEIGLKTTRIRALSGEQVVIGNAALLDERIQNFGRMYERRVAFEFGLIYQTSAQKLREAKRIVEEIIHSAPNARFDRVHFHRFGASSLDFEVVFWVTSPDYNMFMDVNEQVRLAMVERFAEAGLDFAYPTQTVFYAEPSGRPIDLREVGGRLRLAAFAGGQRPADDGQTRKG